MRNRCLTHTVDKSFDKQVYDKVTTIRFQKLKPGLIIIMSEFSQSNPKKLAQESEK